MAEPGGRLSPAEATPPPAELLAALPVATMLIDPEGAIRDANAAAETLLNMSLAAMAGRPLGDVLVPPMDHARHPGEALSLYDQPLMTARGVRFRADFLATPLPERDGWTLILLHHSAAAHRMGHRLERGGGARAAVGAAAMLAHEIKNPLAGIRGAAQLLAADVSGEGVALTELIRAEVDRIANLIDRMEGFTDTRPLAIEPQNIHAVLDHASAIALHGAGDGVTIAADYDPSLPAVLAHRDSLVQVLLNLINNAIEAAENASITLRTAYRHGVSVSLEDGGGRRSLPIELCVVDDGPGAPPDIAEHLFEPFVTGRAAGRGLGLALVDKLVRDMGGIVQYAREGEPERTVFRLLLPRARDQD